MPTYSSLVITRWTALGRSRLQVAMNPSHISAPQTARHTATTRIAQRNMTNQPETF